MQDATKEKLKGREVKAVCLSLGETNTLLQYWMAWHYKKGIKIGLQIELYMHKELQGKIPVHVTEFDFHRHVTCSS